MKGDTLVLAILAFIIVAVATPFQLFDLPIAPVVALLLGAIAGWWVSSTRTRDAGSAGAKAGAAVGLGALLGSVIGLALLAIWVTNIPEVQAYVQNSEPHPEARIPSEWITPLGALAGVVIGLAAGVVDLVLAAIAGWVAGAINGRSHAAV